MTKTAFLFPGQGTQKPGMGMDLKARYPELLNDLYEEADDVVGFPLTVICAQGTPQMLQQMSFTQPAVFLTSFAAATVAAKEGLEPDLVVGHSLGEYAALAWAEVLDWQTTLRLVHLRGQLMGRVHRTVDGKMAAVIGVTSGDVDDLCKAVSRDLGQVVEIANDNEPTQVVISGQSSAVDELLKRVRDHAKQTLVLRIGGPAHSSLMSEAAGEFGNAIQDLKFNDPVIPLVSSGTVEIVQAGGVLRDALASQLVHRVRWVETMALLERTGVSRTLEVGPGKVLSGIVKRHNPGITPHRVSDVETLEATIKGWAA